MPFVDSATQVVAASPSAGKTRRARAGRRLQGNLKRPRDTSKVAAANPSRDHPVSRRCRQEPDGTRNHQRGRHHDEHPELGGLLVIGGATVRPKCHTGNLVNPDGFLNRKALPASAFLPCPQYRALGIGPSVSGREHRRPRCRLFRDRRFRPGPSASWRPSFPP